MPKSYEVYPFISFRTGSEPCRRAGTQRIALRIGDSANTNAKWLVGDHLGSTSVTANYAGTLLSRTLYKPWGEIRYQSGALPTQYTYTGQYSHTADFGLMYYVARWYDPVLGRFAQADSLVPGAGSPLAWDRYAYAMNSPLKNVDPSGHHYCDSKYANSEECSGYNSDAKITQEDLFKLILSVWIESSEGTHSDEAIRMMANVIMNRYDSYNNNEGHLLAPYLASLGAFEKQLGSSAAELAQQFQDPNNGNYESFMKVKHLFMEQYGGRVMSEADPTNGSLFFIHAKNTTVAALEAQSSNMANNYTPEMATAHNGQAYPFTYAISDPYFVPAVVNPDTGDNGWRILYTGNHMCVTDRICGYDEWFNTNPLTVSNTPN